MNNKTENFLNMISILNMKATWRLSIQEYNGGAFVRRKGSSGDWNAPLLRSHLSTQLSCAIRYL